MARIHVRCVQPCKHAAGVHCTDIGPFLTDDRFTWDHLQHVPVVDTLAIMDPIWCHGIWSTLRQVMACCLTATSHYLKQCWHITTDVPWYSPGDSFTGNVDISVNTMFLKTLKLCFLWCASEVPVKYQSDWKSLNPNLAASRHRGILHQDVRPHSE